MRRAIWYLVPILAVAGGWYAHKQGYDAQLWDEAARLWEQWKPVPGPVAPDAHLPPATKRPVIRIATFNLGRFDETKLANARVREIVAQIISRFDLVALQGIQASNQGLLVQLLNQVRTADRDYDFAIAPEVVARGGEPWSAFVFDRTAIAVDRTTVFPIDDAGGRLRRKPLVGSFCARAAKANEAFTFTLINVCVDPDFSIEEQALLPDIYRAVRQGRPTEDDILMVGTLDLDPQKLQQLQERFRLTSPVTNVPTTTRGTRVSDQILFPQAATVEFTGQAGVVDLIREFGLSMPEAVEISDHLPVWVEFSAFEGGQPGRIAVPDPTKPATP